MNLRLGNWGCTPWDGEFGVKKYIGNGIVKLFRIFGFSLFSLLDRILNYFRARNLDEHPVQDLY